MPSAEPRQQNKEFTILEVEKKLSNVRTIDRLRFARFLNSSGTDSSDHFQNLISVFQKEGPPLLMMRYTGNLNFSLKKKKRTAQFGSLSPDCQREPRLGKVSHLQCNSSGDIQGKGSLIFPIIGELELPYSLSARITTFFISLPRLAAFLLLSL